VPQIAALLILFVIAMAAHCLNGQVAIVQIHLNVFLLATRQVNSYFVAVVRLFDIGLHHVCTTLTKGITSLTVHHTFQCSVIPERIEEIIEQIFMENSRHKHKSFLQSRRSGRGKKSEASSRKGFPGEPCGSPFSLPPEHATVIAPFFSSVNSRVLIFTKK